MFSGVDEAELLSATTGAVGRTTAVAGLLLGSGVANAAEKGWGELDRGVAPDGVRLGSGSALALSGKGASITVTVAGNSRTVAEIPCIDVGESAAIKTSKPACSARISTAAISFRRNFKAWREGV